MNLILLPLIALPDGFWDKVIPTLVGSSFLIILFIAGRLLDSQLEKRKSLREMYLSMILIPNQKKIYGYFEELIEKIGEAKNTLERSGELFEEEHRTVHITKQNSIIRNLNRSFEFNIISLIHNYDFKTGKELLEIINVKIIDITSSYYEDVANGNGDYEKMLGAIKEQRANFLKILNDPFSKTNYWFTTGDIILFIIVFVFIGLIINGLIS